MFKRIRQYNYIKKIRKTMKETSLLRFLILNNYKERAAIDLINDKISMDFYKKVFYGGDMTRHYTEANFAYIINYKF
jgi:hypothetical protein